MSCFQTTEGSPVLFCRTLTLSISARHLTHCVEPLHRRLWKVVIYTIILWSTTHTPLISFYRSPTLGRSYIDPLLCTKRHPLWAYPHSHIQARLHPSLAFKLTLLFTTPSEAIHHDFPFEGISIRDCHAHRGVIPRERRIEYRSLCYWPRMRIGQSAVRMMPVKGSIYY